MGNLKNIATVILCGGASRRMGFPKALLPFGQMTLIEYMASLFSHYSDQIVIVKSNELKLPKLSPTIQVINDAEDFQGPLAGIANGLESLGNSAEMTFVTAVDTPLINFKLIDTLFNLMRCSSKDLVIPYNQQYYFPLTAVYRTLPVLSAARELLQQGKKRPVFLMDKLDGQKISFNELSKIDPELESFENMNSRNDYRRILTRMNLPIPVEFEPKTVKVEFFGTTRLITQTPSIETTCDLYDDLIKTIEILFPALTNKVIFDGKLHRSFRLISNGTDFIEDFNLSPNENDSILLMNTDVGG